MKRQRGFLVAEVFIVVWFVGVVYLALDIKHCPEVGQQPFQDTPGVWVCR